MNVGSMIMIANSLGITVSSEDADRIVGAIKNAYNTGWEDALSVAGKAQAVEPEHLLHDAHPPYTAPQPSRQPLPPASPCAMTEAEYRLFKLGWLEAEAAHRIGGRA